MSNVDESRMFRLHFERIGRHGHNTLPASVLVRAVDRIQHVVYLLAKARRGEPSGQRVRFSREIREKFGLICGVPEHGGYVIPLEVGDSAATEAPRNTGDVFAATGMFRDVSSAVETGNVPLLQELIPDSVYREQLVRAYADALPSKVSGAMLWIEDGDHRKVLNSKVAREQLALLSRRNGAKHRNARGIVESGGYVEETGYVAGALAGLNFRERGMQLEALGRRILNATYVEEIESVLMRNRRCPIQVRGNIRRDKTGAPLSIDNVDKVLEIDETPIEKREIVIDNVRYRVVPPLRFEVKFDSKDCLYDLQGDFGILVHAETRNALEDMLWDSLDMLWIEYAQEDPEKLTMSAQRLRAELRCRLRPMQKSDDGESR